LQLDFPLKNVKIGRFRQLRETKWLQDFTGTPFFGQANGALRSPIMPVNDKYYLSPARHGFSTPPIMRLAECV
jgi:hypothetical protein